MSKKDYQAIARAIYAVRTGQDASVSDTRDVLTRARDAIAYRLAADNPRFDRARFIQACETGTCKGMPKRSAA